MGSSSIQTQLLKMKKNKTIRFFLLNGKEIIGKLKEFEQYSITIENEKGILETYYKHTILKITWGQATNFIKIFEKKGKISPSKE